MQNTGYDNYQHFARRYGATIETHPTRLHYESPALLNLIPPVAGQAVLDAGCGAGGYTEWLIMQGAQVTAFDLMPDFVTMTRERVGDQAEVRQADLAQPLDFAADASFDLVLSSLVLHYLADWSAVFQELYRVLKPGGSLVFSTMHPLTDAPALNYFETALYEMVWENFGKPYPVMKVYHRPLSAMLNPLSAAGFMLHQLVEPLPLPELAVASPDEYAFLQQKPIFLLVQAEKIVIG